mgnify:CR=1 FL=1
MVFHEQEHTTVNSHLCTIYCRYMLCYSINTYNTILQYINPCYGISSNSGWEIGVNALSQGTKRRQLGSNRDLLVTRPRVLPLDYRAPREESVRVSVCEECVCVCVCLSVCLAVLSGCLSVF